MQKREKRLIRDNTQRVSTPSPWLSTEADRLTKDYRKFDTVMRRAFFALDMEYRTHSLQRHTEELLTYAVSRNSSQPVSLKDIRYTPAPHTPKMQFISKSLAKGTENFDLMKN